MLKPSVQKALEELRRDRGALAVLSKEDGEGGAYVIVDGVDLGDRYTQQSRLSWVGFRITFQYPFADVYPHFVRPDLTRSDARPLGPGLSGPTEFAGFGRTAIQVSRRSNHRDAEIETAAYKLAKVVDWIRSGA